MRQIILASLVAGLSAGAARAQSDPFHITAAERAACTSDAVRLCAATYPDEGALLACMKQNRDALGSNCAAVFKAGLRSRGLL